jgi:hypothetical protein
VSNSPQRGSHFPPFRGSASAFATSGRSTKTTAWSPIVPGRAGAAGVGASGAAAALISLEARIFAGDALTSDFGSAAHAVVTFRRSLILLVLNPIAHGRVVSAARFAARRSDRNQRLHGKHRYLALAALARPGCSPAKYFAGIARLASRWLSRFERSSVPRRRGSHSRPSRIRVAP